MRALPERFKRRAFVSRQIVLGCFVAMAGFYGCTSSYDSKTAAYEPASQTEIRETRAPQVSAPAPEAVASLEAVNGRVESEKKQKSSSKLAADMAAQGSVVAMAPPKPSPVQSAYTASPVQDAQSAGYYQDVPREQYDKLPENDIKQVSIEPVSTFSIDVDTGAYANVRRFLNKGQLPPHGAVRVEEMINYFPYHYELPKVVEGKVQPFGVTMEAAPTPWNPNTKLLRVGIKASDSAVADLPPANLVFLVDVSGSMERPEGLPLVKKTLALLVEQLRPIDKVSLVTYASGTKVVLEPTSGAEKATIRAAIEKLTAGGSTAGASGIQLAYRMAEQAHIRKGINRILLATDGDFNVGITNFEELKEMVAEKKKSGTTLTTLGYGVDNYNERLMEQLADSGDGNYAYIDTLKEAQKVLVDQLSSTLSVVARDVKIQIEFNPSQASEYRLIGYENRALKREDFDNDKVSAGTIGSGHTVTAIYEIVPKGAKTWLQPLRYQNQKAVEQGNLNHELAMLRIRYKEPESSSSKLIETPLFSKQIKPSLSQASDDLRFAAAVAAFGQILKDGKYTGEYSLGHVADLARGARGEDRMGLRSEFVQLVGLADSLKTRNPSKTPRIAE